MGQQQMLLGAGGIPGQQCLTTSHTDLFGAHKYSGNANSWNGPDGGSPRNVVNNSNLLTNNASNPGFVMTKSVQSNNNNGSGSYPGYGWNFNGTGLGYPIFWTWWQYMNMTNPNNRITDAATYDNTHTGKGFTVQSNYMNYYNQDYGAFMFNESPYYMKVETYTGNGAANHAIDHSLDCVPAVMIIKSIDNSNSNTNWTVYHYKAGNDKRFILNRDTNNTSNKYEGVDWDTNAFNSQTPDRFKFYVGNSAATNASGTTYMCILFAGNHDELDYSRFGGSCNQGFIGCNVYTGNGGSNTSQGLGFAPRCVWMFPEHGEAAYGQYMIPAMSTNVSNLATTDIFFPGNTRAMYSGNFWTPSGSNTFTLNSSDNYCNRNGIKYYYLAFR